MADIFTDDDIRKLFRGKSILILGSSNLRAVYRDMIWLLNGNKIIPESHLRRKLDFSYLGDRLVKQGELNRGRDYLEMREYKKDSFHIKYNFITKCLTKEIEEMMRDFHEKKYNAPDVVIINSCLWDLTRWGPNGVPLYKENMRKLFSLMKASLPPKTLVIFSTTLPVSQYCSGAFLVKQVEFLRHSLRFEVMEANLFARQLVPTYGYNILDLHYHLRMQIHRRVRDGVHWAPTAVRHVTNLFLTHISLSWGVPLPGNFRGSLVERMKQNVKPLEENSMDFANVPLPTILKDVLMPPPSMPPKRRKQKNVNSKWKRDVGKMVRPQGFRNSGLKQVEVNCFSNSTNWGNGECLPSGNPIIIPELPAALGIVGLCLNNLLTNPNPGNWLEFGGNHSNTYTTDGYFSYDRPHYQSFAPSPNAECICGYPHHMGACNDPFYGREQYYQPHDAWNNNGNQRFNPYSKRRM